MRHAPLQGEVLDHIENRPAAPLLRVQVPRVQQVGRREDLTPGAPRLSPLAGYAIVGCAPPGVERHAETHHRLAEQQRFETELRAHHVDPVHALDK